MLRERKIRYTLKRELKYEILLSEGKSRAIKEECWQTELGVKHMDCDLGSIQNAEKWKLMIFDRQRSEISNTYEGE